MGGGIYSIILKSVNKINADKGSNQLICFFKKIDTLFRNQINKIHNF